MNAITFDISDVNWNQNNNEGGKSIQHTAVNQIAQPALKARESDRYVDILRSSGIPYRGKILPSLPWQDKCRLICVIFNLEPTDLPKEKEPSEEATYTSLMRIAEVLKSWIGKYPVNDRLYFIRHGIQANISLEALKKAGQTREVENLLAMLAPINT